MAFSHQSLSVPFPDARFPCTHARTHARSFHHVFDQVSYFQQIYFFSTSNRSSFLSLFFFPLYFSLSLSPLNLFLHFSLSLLNIGSPFDRLKLCRMLSPPLGSTSERHQPSFPRFSLLKKESSNRFQKDTKM